MKIKSSEIKDMISLLDKMIAHSRAMAAKHEDKIKKVHEKYRDSTLNLIHYRTLRLYDIRELQEGLAHLGLSRLGKAEAHVMASMLMNRAILQSLIEEKKIRTDTPHVSFKKGEKLLARNAKELFGYRTTGRRVRIMVTQPSEAANDAQLAENLLQAGMNTARINCAHDSPEEWQKMTAHIQAAHIPVIWATQVLDNLAKKGIPSRAEITDATMSQRAECVMLNKGPHILPAIQLLDQILQNMKHYQLKKAPLLPVMQIGSL